MLARENSSTPSEPPPSGQSGLRAGTVAMTGGKAIGSKVAVPTDKATSSSVPLAPALCGN